MADPMARARKTESLGEVFGRLFHRAADLDPVADHPLEQLLDLPPTERLRTERDILAAALSEPVPAESASERGLVEHRRRLASRLEAAELQLRRGERRDAIQAERTDGCWCLGLRGRGLAFVVYHHGVDAEGEPIPWLVRGPDGEPVEGFHEYCACPDGEGFRARNVALAARGQNEHRARNVARLWDGIGVPTRFAEATLASYLERSPGNVDLVAGLRDWLESDPWLVLWGPVGRGKTGLAAALVRELVDRGNGVLFRTVPDLLDRLKATYSGDGREHELLAALYDVDVLVLDDVGVDRSTDWTIERLFRIIDHRHNEARRTILTTNLSPGELATFLGARNFDRLREMTRGNAGFVRVDGPNLRESAPGGVRNGRGHLAPTVVRVPYADDGVEELGF